MHSNGPAACGKPHTVALPVILKAESMTEFRYHIPHPEHHRDQLRIPECHTLHACPPACARHSALRALRNGEGSDYSFCFLSLLDMALGGQEEHIAAAVDELLERLDPTPRAFLVKLYCIDELVGTDAHAIAALLSKRHPDIVFSVVRSSPLVKRGTHDDRMQAGVYDLLEKTGDRDWGVNLIGRFNPIPASSEFMTALGEWGISTVRSVASCKTFEEYRRIADSALNLSVSWMGQATVHELQRKLDIPSFFFKPAYAVEEVDGNYRRLYETLRDTEARTRMADAPRCPWVLEPPSRTSACHAARVRAEQAVARAREVIGNVPIALDTFATFFPFSMACALLGYGFNVETVFALHVKSDDAVARSQLEQDYPAVQVVAHAKSAMLGEGQAGRQADVLSIGSDAATMTGSTMFLDLFHDEGCFGYDGIVRLMDGLVEAYENGHATIGEEEDHR